MIMPGWIEPLALAHHFRKEAHLFLLYSGRKEAHTGKYSYLGIGAKETIKPTSFSELPTQGQWFGYLGYDMRHDVEHYTSSKPSFVTFPPAIFTQPEHLFVFNHDDKTIHIVGDQNLLSLHNRLEIPSTPTAPHITNIQSNFTDTAYLHAISNTIAHIEAGDFYQANLTRKYTANLQKGDGFDIFLRLCEASPAPYSAFLKWDNKIIISSSPECFLRIDHDNTITARPIKGSAGRSTDDSEDIRIQHALKTSAKDHAENLMIVDLLRNDLARVSETGSVEVIEQSGLYSYTTIHHLVSTIRAKIKPTSNRAEVLKACFPPGSMTGAPKIAAVEWCTKQEQLERGVYSGAIGWLGENNECNFSVVIRTIIIRGNQLEFQVGGGIVADSIPQKELEETITKARGICTALGIDVTQLQC